MSEPTAHQSLTRAGLSAQFADLVLERHAHQLAEQLREQCDCGEQGTCRCPCADLIDPKAQR